MRARLIVGLMLVTAAFWLQAQEGIPGADVWVPADSYPPTVKGCLRQAGFYYGVVGDNGEVYNLTGRTGGLKRLVGHQVEVTGKPTVISLDTTEIHEASSVEEVPALEVRSVKELPGPCTSQPQ
jgi:hypothetical protein